MNDIPDHFTDESLFAFLDGQLSASEEKAFERHLAACRSCSAELERMQALFSDLESLSELPLQVDLADRVLARLPRPAPAPRFLRAASALQLLAAAVILVLAIPLLLLQPGFVEWSAGVQNEFESLGARLEPLSAFVSTTILAAEDLIMESVQGFGQPDALAAVAATLIPLLASSSLLWIIGNGILIPRLRRDFSRR